MNEKPLEATQTATAMQQPAYQQSLDHDTDHDAKEHDAEAALPQVSSQKPVIEEDAGVSRIEALYLVYGKGWGLWSLWASIGLIAYVYALSRSTTYYYAAFATSAFGEHTIVGTIGVINGIIAGVAPPFIAKLADIWSRPHTLLLVVTCYAVGYAMCAGAQNVGTVVAGQLIYTIGNTGITFLNSLIIADITSLQWRAFVDGAVNLPYVVNAFVAGYITSGVNGYSVNGWRWGYGMFCILLPVCVSPALAVLLIGDHRAKKLGTISLATSSQAARQRLNNEQVTHRTRSQSVRYYWSRLNGFGMLLMGFAFALLLTPMTLNTTAIGGYKNPSLIAMLVIGGLLFIAWGVWDGFFATYPIMPKRVFNRTFIACVAIDFFYFFSSYLIQGYLSSWVWVVTDYSARDYTFFSNALSVTQCSLAIFVGLAMRLTHRFKYIQVFGLCLFVIGTGLTYKGSITPTTAVLVSSQVIVGAAGAVSVTSSWVAVQGSVPHQDMAIAVAVLNLWSSIGSSISLAISSSVWNKNVPANLEKYVGEYFNATERAEIFGSIYVARLSEHRDLIKQAYMESVRGVWLAAIVVAALGLIAGLFASNYYLGESHNSVETDKIIKFRTAEEIAEATGHRENKLDTQSN